MEKKQAKVKKVSTKKRPRRTTKGASLEGAKTRMSGEDVVTATKLGCVIRAVEQLGFREGVRVIHGLDQRSVGIEIGSCNDERCLSVYIPIGQWNKYRPSEDENGNLLCHVLDRVCGDNMDEQHGEALRQIGDEIRAGCKVEGIRIPVDLN